MYEVIIVSLTFLAMLTAVAVAIVAPFAYVMYNIEKRKKLEHVYAPSFTVLTNIK